MTPQFCVDWCGERGYTYGGIEFGTMSLYQIKNPHGNASEGSSTTAFTPACQTSPLCSHKVCDTSLSTSKRVASLVESMTLEEKILNLVDAAAGSRRLGLPSYEWWSEATHGVGSAPGVQFPRKPANFSYATSFPAPILSAASFDDALIQAIGNVVGKEGRAFGNYGFSGFDFWAPNINPFRDPRWGRGQETPGEDIFHIQSYVRSFVPGLQGDDPLQKQTIATCKHYAVYDIETGRHEKNYNPTQKDLSDYYLAPFKTCVRDVDVGSIMCSYNAVDGVPACANEYLLQDLLREQWNFTAEYQYVVSDCGAVTDIWQNHNYTDSEEAAASVALNAGTDLECGSSYVKLNESLAMNQTSVARIDGALARLYAALFTIGFFDGSKYHALGFSDVATPEAQALAYKAAVEGMTLLKNDGTLPLPHSQQHRRVAVIGPFANATTQMQGDYSGTAAYLQSPLQSFGNYTGWNVTYAMGTTINAQNTTDFEAALIAARNSDLIIYLGGIDNSIEAEELDRTSLVWPGNQLELIVELSKLHKPLVVIQFGGGQLDDSVLLANTNVNSLIWAGYPSQAGGQALLDVLVGKKSIAGRLPVTQYPASYADEVSIFDINLSPNGTFPGRTYKWYTGRPILPFGYGLHYTTFDFHWTAKLKREYDIRTLVDQCRLNGPINDRTPFADVSADVENTGRFVSDFVGLLFISSADAGPVPRPNKSLVSYSRLHDIPIGKSQQLRLPLTLGSLARADESGDLVIFPGNYKLALDVDNKLVFNFSLLGEPLVIERFQT
ncbi:hypothetical protein ACMFMF_002748 [Clarireedia jacksonii]